MCPSPVFSGIFSLFLHMFIKDSCRKCIPQQGNLPGSGSRNKKNGSFVKRELKASDVVVHKRMVVPPSVSKIERKMSKLFFYSLSIDVISPFLITTFSNQLMGFSALKRSHVGIWFVQDTQKFRGKSMIRIQKTGIWLFVILIDGTILRWQYLKCENPEKIILSLVILPLIMRCNL